MSRLAERDLGRLHHGMELFAFAFGMYNLLRFSQERSWRNAVNAGVYFALAVWERSREQDHREISKV